MMDFLTKPEVLMAIGVGLSFLLPRQVWETVPILRAIFTVVEAGYKAYEAKTREEVLKKAAQAAEEAVKGTEQLIQSGQVDKATAKAQVVSFLMSNFALDQGTAELLTERAVLTLKQ